VSGMELTGKYTMMAGNILSLFPQAERIFIKLLTPNFALLLISLL
jgi:hypothetical protein